MTTIGIDAIGYCAHYSTQGDWAFDVALRLARWRTRPLNIFHFLTDPYVPGPQAHDGLSAADRDRLALDRERELRFYYDGRLGDYVDAGFRVCENEAWTELHRCLCQREFQVLVLGFPAFDASFGGKPIVDFARNFVCPVVLVGPDRSDSLYLNAPAAHRADAVGLEPGAWSALEPLGAVVPA